MALTTVQNNNKLVVFTKDINREFVRENLFSPYMGTAINSIIYLRNELKSGGDQMNIPLVTKLRSPGVGSGTLVGNEDVIDNYGMRVWIDWKRNAIVMKKNAQRQQSADLFGEAKPLLSDWGKEVQRDNIIEAFMALPSGAAPSGYGTDDGQTINGIRYEAASNADLNTWNANNADRILYGGAIGNYNATHATALANITTASGKLTAATVSLAKRRAMTGTPAIRPFKTRDGYEYYVMFAGMAAFRDLKTDATIVAANKDARAREGDGMDKNPLFQDGDLIYDGVIIRQIPEISLFVDNVWTSLKTAGNGGTRVEPYFLCGQQALAFAWGQMARPTTRNEDDYGFVDGVGVEMAYGVAKTFKEHPTGSGILKQWATLTGFVSAASDS